MCTLSTGLAFGFTFLADHVDRLLQVWLALGLHRPAFHGPLDDTLIAQLAGDKKKNFEQTFRYATKEEPFLRHHHH